MLTDLLYVLLLLIGSPYFLYKYLRKRRGPYSIGQRLYLRRLPPRKCDVLVHCVSVGEIEAGVPIVGSLRAAGLTVTVSVITKAGHEVARKRFGDEAVVLFPLDFSFSVSQFLDSVNPGVVALLELELWPNFIRGCSRRNIDVLILNGRMTERSLRGYGRLRWVFSRVWPRLRWIGTQDDSTAARFIAAGALPDRVQSVGSVKFDRVPPEGWEKARAELGFPEDSMVLFAGSTHDGEEELVLNAFASLARDFPNARLVLAPRHMERVPVVEKILRSTSIDYALRSSRQTATVVLLDTMGELAILYGAADIVIMGGTLLPGVGGHNPLEAAVLGKPVICGQHFSNFSDVISRLHAAKGVIILGNVEDLALVVVRLAGNPADREAIGRSGRDAVEASKGATALYVAKTIEHCKMKGSAK